MLLRAETDASLIVGRQRTWARLMVTPPWPADATDVMLAPFRAMTHSTRHKLKRSARKIASKRQPALLPHLLMPLLLSP